MKKRKRNCCAVLARRDEGFTFVETLAVIAVSSILAAQAGVAVNSLVQKSRCASARAQISSFTAALQSYYADCGVFPSSEQGLEALWTKPELIPVPQGWSGPYTDKKNFADPWGTPYSYLTQNSSVLPEGTPEGLPFVLLSYGADRKEGGKGNDKDIISWE